MIKCVTSHDIYKAWKLFTVKYKTKRQNSTNVTKFVHKSGKQIGNDTSYSIYVIQPNFKVIISFTQVEEFL